MKILFIGILFLSFNTFAEISMFTEVKGIERSVTEAQQIFSTVSLQTKIFFEKESIGLKSIFPEFESKALIKKINETRIEFVNDEDLIDNNGVKRTCLNFPTLLKIKCSVSEFEKFSRTPKAVYVLVLHEYLDLLGVKETVPLIDNMVDEYKISKKIFPYILYNGNGLVYINKSSKKIFLITDYENKLKVQIWDLMVRNNWLVERYTSFYPSEKRLVKHALSMLKECEKPGEKIIYKDAQAYSFHNSRIACSDDRCPTSEGFVVVRWICE